MARPLKHGLDYFPMDVDFFEDDKLQFVSSRFDEKGELIAIKLLCKIFKSGYFIKWDDDAALLFAKGAGRNISPSLANDVVNELIKRGFFHQGLFERFAVLTSNGIQKRYIHICLLAKRKDWKIEEKYDVNLFTPEETRLTPEETSKTHGESTQSKVKESKVKKRKGKEIAGAGGVKENHELTNPFSEKFIEETWPVWKQYKQKEKKFSFRTVESEQAALNKLVEISGGDENTAREIILESMANGWSGLFPLKNDTNGQSTSKNGRGPVGAQEKRAAVNQEFAEFYSKGR